MFVAFLRFVLLYEQMFDSMQFVTICCSRQYATKGGIQFTAKLKE